jgi:lysine-N-methylase
LNQAADGGCVFLNEKGLCRIHAKFGLDAKPLACRVFPFVLVPAGDSWRVGYRYACPSVANDLGKPFATFLPAIREYGKELEEREGIKGRVLPVPQLQRAQTVPWSDIDLFIRCFRDIIRDTKRPLEWRLRKCAAVINLCRDAKFDIVTGDRLKEFLAVVSDGVNPEVPTHLEAVAPPGWIGRILFRQTVAIYARKDVGPRRGISRHGRLALLWAAWKFAQGIGQVPRVHGLLPEVTFEQIEQPLGPLPEINTAMLTRYYQIKIESGQFFGPTNFKRQFWDGLETLLLTYPAILWLSRAFRDRTREEALTLGLRIVDDNFGFNPLLGSRRQLLSSRLLARRGELSRLIAWYSR